MAISKCSKEYESEISTVMRLWTKLGSFAKCLKTALLPFVTSPTITTRRFVHVSPGISGFPKTALRTALYIARKCQNDHNGSLRTYDAARITRTRFLID